MKLAINFTLIAGIVYGAYFSAICSMRDRDMHRIQQQCLVKDFESMGETARWWEDDVDPSPVIAYWRAYGGAECYLTARGMCRVKPMER